MKKFLILTLSALFAAGLASAGYKTGYYDAMNGKKKEALKAAAKACVQKHTQLNYTDLPNNWVYTDIYPELVNGQKRWWDMYSNETYLIRNGETGRESFSRNQMQREHSVPKSWWKVGNNVEYTPAYSDIYNLYPSDGPANQAKSNYPLGPVGTSSFNNGVTKVGTPKSGYGGGASKVFEPADEYKGDFARAYFYVYTVYNDLEWTSLTMGTKGDWPTLKPWAYEMLLEWARQDPVSQKEIERNDAAEKQQGNRNPFVDFPQLAEYIWGTRTTETFYIADQSGENPPPITGDPEITMPEDGEALDFGEVAVGSEQERVLSIRGNNLKAALSLRVTGTDRRMFSVSESSISASAINSGDTYEVQVFYTPTETGSHTATLSLYDGGLPDGTTISVQLRGSAAEVPALTPVVALPASEITPTGYRANWEPAKEQVDYYIVTRIRYVSNDQVTTTANSNDTYVDFSGREENVDEAYYVQSSRLGVVSQKSNTIMVAASGMELPEGTTPLAIGIDRDGFVILSDGIQSNVRVFDAAGAAVRVLPEAGRETFVALPSGFYIVTSDQARRPIKIVIP